MWKTSGRMELAVFLLSIPVLRCYQPNMYSLTMDTMPWSFRGVGLFLSTWMSGKMSLWKDDHACFKYKLLQNDTKVRQICISESIASGNKDGEHVVLDHSMWMAKLNPFLSLPFSSPDKSGIYFSQAASGKAGKVFITCDLRSQEPATCSTSKWANHQAMKYIHMCMKRYKTQRS